MSVASGGTFDFEGGGDTDPTLDGVDVSLASGGMIEVGAQSSTLLTLDDGTRITGGTMTIAGTPYTAIDIAMGDGASGATFNGVTVTNSAQIVVESGANLTLEAGPQSAAAP